MLSNLTLRHSPTTQRCAIDEAKIIDIFLFQCVDNSAFRVRKLNQITRYNRCNHEEFDTNLNLSNGPPKKTNYQRLTFPDFYVPFMDNVLEIRLGMIDFV